MYSSSIVSPLSPSKSQEKSQGNVLFLILIAVALFAALSYAVTQSTHSGGSNASSEKASLDASTILSYQAGVKMATDRMVISQGISPDDIDFMLPNDPAFNTPPFTNKIYHPQGGGLTFQQVPMSALAANAWYTDFAWLENFNPVGVANAITFQPPPVIVTVPSGSPVKGAFMGRFNNFAWSATSAQDIVFSAAGISRPVCQALNEKLTGSTNIPVVSNAETYTVSSTYNSTGGNGDLTSIQCASCENQAAMCIADSASGPYYFYNLVMSR